jgi:hypothetical protein
MKKPDIHKLWTEYLSDENIKKYFMSNIDTWKLRLQ